MASCFINEDKNVTNTTNSGTGAVRNIIMDDSANVRRTGALASITMAFWKGNNLPLSRMGLRQV